MQTIPIRKSNIDGGKRPMPFLEVSPSSIEYISSQLNSNLNSKINDDDKKLSDGSKDFDNIITFWTTLTKASDVIQNGQRLENISWRLINRKLILNDQLSKADLSTIIDISKGNKCKELKENILHRKKIQKRISNSNLSLNSPSFANNTTTNSITSLDTESTSYSPKINNNIKQQVKRKQSPIKHAVKDDIVNGTNNNRINNNNNIPSLFKKNSPKSEQTQTKSNIRKTKFFIDHSSPDSSSISPPKLLSKDKQNKSISSVIENKNDKIDRNINLKINNDNTNKNNNISSLFGPKSDGLHSLVNQVQKNNISIKPNPMFINNIKNNSKHKQEIKTPSLFSRDKQPKTTQTGTSTLFHSSQIKNESEKLHAVKSQKSPTSITSVDSSIKSHTSLASKTSLFVNQRKISVEYTSSDDSSDYYDDDDDDDDYDDDDDEDDDDDDDDDDASEWSSLSDDEDHNNSNTNKNDYNKQFDFKKKNVSNNDDESVNGKQTLKRSLLSGLFLNEMGKQKEIGEDKHECENNTDSNSSKHTSPKLNDNFSSTDPSLFVNNKRHPTNTQRGHYDSHHKSNAPPTAVTLLPTALATHIFLPTKNFQTFQSTQRQQYHGQPNHYSNQYHHIPQYPQHNSHSHMQHNQNHHLPNTKQQRTYSLSIGNEKDNDIIDKNNITKLTRDNIAKYANVQVEKSVTEGYEEVEYSSSIKTSTSSIDIPGSQDKILREKLKREKQFELERQKLLAHENIITVDELPKNLVDSINKENKLLGNNNCNNNCNNNNNKNNKINTTNSELGDELDNSSVITEITNNHYDNEINGYPNLNKVTSIFTSDGFVDDTIVKKIYGGGIDDNNEDDLNYHARGW